jgi:hypothetical protein
MGGVTDLAVNLLASVISGLAVWLFTWLGRRRRTERQRAFFGVRPGTRALVVVSRHMSSPNDLSVHQDDAAAVVDLAAMVRACGGETDLVGNDRAPAALGAVPEFCIGGPGSNARIAVHLRLLVPGVDLAGRDRGLDLTVGARTWSRDPDTVHALVARLHGPAGGAPVFLVCGQTARANRAAARWLVANHIELARRHGTGGRFAVVVRLRGADAYGTDAVDSVTDVTADAFTARAAASSV